MAMVGGGVKQLLPTLTWPYRKVVGADDAPPRAADWADPWKSPDEQAPRCGRALCVAQL